MSLFGHVARVIPDVPANQALWMQTDLSTGRKPEIRWRQTPGWPRKTRCSQMWTDVGMSPRNYWDACIHRCHSGVTQWSTRASRWRRWWWCVRTHSVCIHIVGQQNV